MYSDGRATTAKHILARHFSFVLFENFSFLKFSCHEIFPELCVKNSGKLLFCQFRFEQIPVSLVSYCHYNNDHNNNNNDNSIMIMIALYPLRCVQ